MKLMKAIFSAISHMLVFVVVPFILITLINLNYPGILAGKENYLMTVVIFVGIPIALSYFIMELTESPLKKMIFEILAISLVLIWTFLVMGAGETVIYYLKIKIILYYPALLTLILISISIRYPAAILRYYSAKQMYAQMKTPQNSVQEAQ